MQSKIYTILPSVLAGILIVATASLTRSSEPIESIKPKKSQDSTLFDNAHFIVVKTKAKAFLSAGWVHKKKILSILSIAGGACAVIYAARSGIQIPYWTNVKQAAMPFSEQNNADHRGDDVVSDSPLSPSPSGGDGASDRPPSNPSEDNGTSNEMPAFIDDNQPEDSTAEAIKPVIVPINPSMTDDWIPTPYPDAELARPQDRKYTVNLMWLNRELERNQQFIHPAANEEQLREKLLDPVIQWAINTQGGTVNLWFDSFMTPPEAVQRTRLIIDQLTEQQAYSAPILLRDIRNLPEVQQNSEVFSAQTPVYFRVDLVRAIIEVNSIRTKETEAAVAADVDMQPLTCDQLFDSETIGNLEKNGIVMARGGHLGFENGFQIVSHHNPNLIEAMQHALIDLNIERGRSGLAGQIFGTNGKTPPYYDKMGPLKQIIYNSYPQMFQYFYHLEGRGELKIKYPPERRGKYDKNTAVLPSFRCYDTLNCSHSTSGNTGLWPFNLHKASYSNDDNLFLRFTAVDKSIQDEWGGVLVPTKHVPLPPAGLEYD